MNDQTVQASNYIKDHTHQFGQVFHKSEMVVAADSVISVTDYLCSFTPCNQPLLNLIHTSYMVYPIYI